LNLQEIASRFTVYVGVVPKILNIYEEYCKYTDPPKKRTGRPQLLESNPLIYLDKIKQKPEAVCGVSVSMATISRFVRSRDFTEGNI